MLQKLKMGRIRVRKTEYHGQTDGSTMRAAVAMINDGLSLRVVAELLKISKSTLQRYVAASKKNSEGKSYFFSFSVPYW